MNYFGGVVAALMAWPIGYMLFNSSENSSRITSSTIIAIVSGVTVAVLTGSSSKKRS